MGNAFSLTSCTRGLNTHFGAIWRKPGKDIGHSREEENTARWPSRETVSIVNSHLDFHEDKYEDFVVGEDWWDGSKFKIMMKVFVTLLHYKELRNEVCNLNIFDLSVLVIQDRLVQSSKNICLHASKLRHLEQYRSNYSNPISSHIVFDNWTNNRKCEWTKRFKHVKKQASRTHRRQYEKSFHEPTVANRGL